MRRHASAMQALLAVAAVVAVAVGGCADIALPSPVGPTSSASHVPSPSAVPSAGGSPSAVPATPAPTPAGPTLEQLVGQRMVVTFGGATPSAAFLQRIRRGEVGGVILFGRQSTSEVALKALTSLLHRTALGGGNPPLLVMTDQEGGSIRRLRWAPPELSAWAMGEELDASGVRKQGRLTGEALRAAGIDVDLAPVADVPAKPSGFMYADRRVFSLDSAKTATLATAFADGLADAGVLATMKHFPGLGRASLNTDLHLVKITASEAAMAWDLAPYRPAIDHGVPLIMLSNAVYTAWDAANAAGWSPAIAGALLRDQLGFTGVTITDGLDGAAASRHTQEKALALKAARAGVDLLLLTGSEPVAAGSYQAVLAAARDGTLPMASLLASYQRILALKGVTAP